MTGGRTGTTGGASNLTSQVTFDDSLFSLFAASADLNGDGLLDLATVGFDSSLTVLVGEPDGGLSAPVTYPGVADGYAIAAGDINGDGRPDVAVSNGASVAVLVNDGTGHLSLQGSYATNSQVRAIAIGDLNGDGLGDLLVAESVSEQGRAVELFWGSSGTFAAPVGLPGLSGSALGGVAVGDLNDDGLVDIVANSADGSQLAVLLNEGDGGFTTDLYPTQASGQVILVAKDAATPPDIFLGLASDGLQLLKNSGQGQFSIVPKYSVPGGIWLTTGDFNGDGIPDVATTSNINCQQMSWGISVLYGDGDGGFGNAQSLTYTRTAPSGLAALGPVDSPRELAIVDACGGGITVYQDLSP